MADDVHVHSKPEGVSLGASITIFLLLVIILAVFGDLFTFIFGLIGLVITFAAFYTDHSADDH
ncbi:hypothetical protein [Dyadobacter frigoris]|uniref:Uncharacterized protein n=1 Tax=Dyadobacter frigoris TaxID=2576211 RepID=A0A4U6D8E1_9BACT|nr:hypothetical protein [Dyadobacter frigoris]TKT93036.1 hypothetical protein FDK13_04045 [Dyadobacter frigoris]GLU55908.1 hypothetical protein Dfri01_53690 [Dyadobacter frigoris]